MVLDEHRLVGLGTKTTSTIRNTLFVGEKRFCRLLSTQTFQRKSLNHSPNCNAKSFNPRIELQIVVQEPASLKGLAVVERKFAVEAVLLNKEPDDGYLDCKLVAHVAEKKRQQMDFKFVHAVKS